MTTQPGDCVAPARTADPGARLRPGDQGTVTGWDPARSQLRITWDCGSTLSLLPGDGDRVRLIARAAAEDGTEPVLQVDPAMLPRMNEIEADPGDPAQQSRVWRAARRDRGHRPDTGIPARQA